MEQVFISLAASGGAIAAGLIGWFESGEPFVARKFWPTLLRAAIAGGVVAFSYPFVEMVGLWTGLTAAFFAGAGVDVLGHRLVGAVVAKPEVPKA
jgi:hypothetical protein